MPKDGVLNLRLARVAVEDSKKVFEHNLPPGIHPPGIHPPGIHPPGTGYQTVTYSKLYKSGIRHFITDYL